MAMSNPIDTRNKQLLAYIKTARSQAAGSDIEKCILEDYFEAPFFLYSHSDGTPLIERLNKVSTLDDVDPYDFPYLQISTETLGAYKNALLQNLDSLEDNDINYNLKKIKRNLIPKIDAVIDFNQRLSLEEGSIDRLFQAQREKATEAYQTHIKEAGEDKAAPHHIFPVIAACQDNFFHYVLQHLSGNCGSVTTSDIINRSLESDKRYAGVFAAALAMQDSMTGEETPKEQISRIAANSCLRQSIRSHVKYGQYEEPPSMEECAQTILGDDYPEIVDELQYYATQTFQGNSKGHLY